MYELIKQMWYMQLGRKFLLKSSILCKITIQLKNLLQFKCRQIKKIFDVCTMTGRSRITMGSDTYGSSAVLPLSADRALYAEPFADTFICMIYETLSSCRPLRLY